MDSDRPPLYAAASAALLPERKLGKTRENSRKPKPPVVVPSPVYLHASKGPDEDLQETDASEINSMEDENPLIFHHSHRLVVMLI